MAENKLLLTGLAWLVCCALSCSAWAGRPVRVYEVDLKGGQSPASLQDAMREASRIVLNGFELGTDATVVRHPDRYMDERGTVMWKRVMALMDLASACDEGVVVTTTGCCSADNTPAVTPNSATQCQ